MTVYLIAAGPGRHVLYYEPSGERAAHHGTGGHPIWRRLHERFTRVLAAIEREPDPAAADPAAASRPEGWTARLRARMMRWMAERVLEQRVLWHLQGQRRVHALHSDRIDARQALAIVQSVLAAEWRRHRKLLALDTFYLLT